MSSDPPASSYLESGRPRDDRLQGEKAESLFQDFLRKKGRHPESNPGGFHPEWDVRDEAFTYEVKLDRMHPQTGNFYVERKSLFNSKADYLVYLYEEAEYPRRYFIAIAPSAKVRNALRHQQGIKGGDFQEPGWLLWAFEFHPLFRPFGYIIH